MQPTEVTALVIEDKQPSTFQKIVRNRATPWIAAGLVLAVFFLWYIFRPESKPPQGGVEILQRQLDSVTAVLRRDIQRTSDSVIHKNLKAAAAQMEWMEQTPFKVIKERTKYETIIMSVDTTPVDELIRLIEDRERRAAN